MLNWGKYGFKVRPVIPVEDYRHRLVNLQSEMEDYTSQIIEQARQARRYGRVYRQIWGSGKSVFLYNVADRLNSEMFLGHGLEGNGESKYDHILAIFYPQPVKENTLLESALNAGFPQIGSSEAPRNWGLFLHVLSYVTLRRALLEGKTTDAKSLSGSLGDISRCARVQESIERLGSKTREKAIEVATSFLERVLGPVRTKDRTIVTSNLPILMNRIDTSEFNDAFNALLSSRNKALLNFEIFNTVCRESRIFLFMVFDQMEEYRGAHLSVLNKIVVDQQYRNIHACVVERSDISEMMARKLRESYETITRRLALRILPPLDPAGFQEMAAMYLDEFRNGSPIIGRKFPFRDDAIEYLRQRSQSNPRKFLSCINDILPKALALDLSEISEADLKKPQMAAVIASALRAQEGLGSISGEMEPR